MHEVTKKASKVAPMPQKITRAQIATKVIKTDEDKEKEKIKTHLDAPLIENVNRLEIDGEEARTVEQAISILGYVIKVYACLMFKTFELF